MPEHKQTPAIRGVSVWLPVVALMGWCTSAAAQQLTNPLPEPASSGITLLLEPWVTIPQSSGSAPRARIDHLKPCPDGARLFCNDLNGKLWVLASKNATTPTLFVDMAGHFSKFTAQGGLGTGLASFAFHPEFVAAGKPGYGKFYTMHSETPNGTPDFTGPATAAAMEFGVLTEWTMTNPANTAITASPANFTKRELLRIRFPHNFHTIQEISFDPTAQPGDENYGCLFLCFGEGGAVAINLPNNAGRIDSPMGTIMRITPILAQGQSAANFTLSANGKYYIPSGPANANPFVTAADPTPGDGFPVVREIYAYGFRNPHRISWDAAGTHKMFCGNIGESMIEEIELIVKGGNYGWPSREGSYRFLMSDKTHVYPLTTPDTGPPNSPPEPAAYTYPVSQYDHDAGRRAVIGGYVYRGSAIPELQGRYLHADNVNGAFFVASEAQMILPASPTTGVNPAPPQSVQLKLGSTSATFLSIIGASRADLRFGIDHDGELYVSSKQNGVIYRIKRDTGSGGGPQEPPVGTLANWTKVRDFENGSTSGISSTAPAASTQVVIDPREGPSNRVLRLETQNSTASQGFLPVTQIPNGSFGTLFFRFYITSQSPNFNWGLSDISNPPDDGTFNAFEVQLRADAGSIAVRDGSVFSANLFPYQLGTWYSAWLHINNATNANDRWNLYIQGGQFGVPTLVKANSAFRFGTTSALQTFYWRFQGVTSVYLDDIQVDVGHYNLTSPVIPDWRVIDNFEGASPLTSWTIPSSSAQSMTVQTEAGGNHYLRRAASSSATPNLNAIAAKPLPFMTQVSERVTLFFRMRIEGGSLNQSFGLANEPPSSDVSQYQETDYEPQMRISSIGSPGSLDLYNGPPEEDDFVPATIGDGNSILPPLQTGVWYKVWIVAYNGGFASGGQTWTAYLQGGNLEEQTQLGETLFFRREAETPITHFLAIATTGASNVYGNNAVWLDDIYAFEGENLADPLGPTWIPLALGTNGNQITLTYSTTFNRAFQIYESTDLIDWLPIGTPVEGDGNQRQITLDLNGPRKFFHAAELPRR